MTKKNISILSFLLALVLSVSAFGQTALTRTTLGAAVTTTSTTTVVLASYTGVVATSTVIFVDQEAMFVNAVNSSNVQVTRGYNGTQSGMHANAAIVWAGPPQAFVYQPPTGSCTRATMGYFPTIAFGVGGVQATYSDCIGGYWVNGVSTPLVPTVWFTPAPGGSVLTGVGTSTATTNTSMYCSEINLPFNKLVTGLGILNGATTANGHRDVALYDASGNLLASSGTTTTTGTASTYQQFAFTTPYFAVGPARYFGCSQAQSSSDTLNLVVTANGNAGLLTQIYTGQTYGTIPTTITAPTAYTTAQGPYWYFY